MSRKNFVLFVCFILKSGFAQGPGSATSAIPSNNRLIDITSASNDSPERLNCSMDQDNRWTYERTGSNSIEEIATNLTVYNIVSSQNVGVYQCRTAGGETEVFETGNLTAPYIPHTGQSITYSEQSVNQTVQCISYSYPLPTFRWFLRSDDGNKQLLSNRTDSYVITNDERGISTITFVSVSLSHRGTYSCEVTNGVTAEEKSTSILLRVRSRFAVLYPIIGIICEAIVIVVIVFIIRRNAAKKEKEFGMQFQELNSSEESQESRDLTVRYRNTANRS